MSFPWEIDIMKMEKEMSFLTAEMECNKSDPKQWRNYCRRNKNQF
jgi:hypothetical protein